MRNVAPYYDTLYEAIVGDKLDCLLCDFDDTLFAWMDIYGDEKAEQHYRETTILGKNFYGEYQQVVCPLDFMQAFCAYMRPRVKKMYVLTWDIDSTNYRAKQAAAHTACPECFDDVIASGSRENKLLTVNNLCRVLGFERERILLVDDNTDTCFELRKAGYRACSPTAVYAALRLLHNNGVIKFAPEMKLIDIQK